ncbi:uncharacterized protein LOC119339350 [Triticum dicoccoides]|uniref:uncharacterized protein LOC119339350 n=1 Tax=Triticum dicoccoides TaxID=85692 RepID=UPI001891E134|nr:uncharacterized protein LOC119339350 [Triticum dicoccoides]
MATDTAYAKRVLLACNGGADAVLRGVGVGLARHGCRLVLVGDEGALAATVEEVRRSAAEGAAAIAVVGMDLAACDEAATCSFPSRQVTSPIFSGFDPRIHLRTTPPAHAHDGFSARMP